MKTKHGYRIKTGHRITWSTEVSGPRFLSRGLIASHAGTDYYRIYRNFMNGRVKYPDGD